MIVTRINGLYSIEAKSVAPNDLVSDLEHLITLIRIDNNSTDDCLYITGCEEKKNDCVRS